MAENLFNSDHKANSQKFLDNYDRIFRRTSPIKIVAKAMYEATDKMLKESMREGGGHGQA